MVITLPLDELSCSLSLGFESREWGDHDLGVSSQQKVAQDLEVRVKAFDAPLHRESVNRDHHALILGQASESRSHVLVNSCDDAGAAHIARQDCLLGHSGVSAFHDG